MDGLLASVAKPFSPPLQTELVFCSRYKLSLKIETLSPILTCARQKCYIFVKDPSFPCKYFSILVYYYGYSISFFVTNQAFFVKKPKISSNSHFYKWYKLPDTTFFSHVMLSLTLPLLVKISFNPSIQGHCNPLLGLWFE